MSTVMTDADSNRLLKRNGGLGAQSGLYSETQLAMRAKCAREIGERYERCRRRTISSMLLEVIAEDLDRLPLNNRQKCLFRLALNGCTSSQDIGDWMGLSKATVVQEYKRARRQLKGQVWVWLDLCDTFDSPILQSNWPALLKHLSAMRGI